MLKISSSSQIYNEEFKEKKKEEKEEKKCFYCNRNFIKIFVSKNECKLCPHKFCSKL